MKIEKPGHPGDAAQNQNHEQKGGDVEGADEPGEIDHLADAVLADGEGHGAEGTDGRELHHEADDAEEDLAGRVDGVRDRLAALAHAGHHDAGEDRDEKNLEQVTRGESVEEALRDQSHDVAGDGIVGGDLGVFLNRFTVELAHIGIETGARLHHLTHKHADEERNGRDHLEIDQRLQAYAADLLQVADGGDAVDDGTEDDRRDHHLDPGR